MSTTLTCTHLHSTGKRCGSPALRGERFCFYHHPTRRPPARAPRAASQTPFYIEPIVDAETLQINLSEILRRLADNTLDTHRAGLLIATLQMAKANLPALTVANARYRASAAAPKSAPHSTPGMDFSDLSQLLAELSPHPTPAAPKL